MNYYYLVFFLFISSCSFSSSGEEDSISKVEVSPSREEVKVKIGDNTVELLLIQKQYCFENGLCTGYINHRVDARGLSIDSIVSMDFGFIDSFEIENINKIDIEKSQDQAVIDLFLKGLIIFQEFKMKNGEKRFPIPSDWFFDGLESAKERILGVIKDGDGDEFDFQINNFSEIKSLDLLIKEMIRTQDDKIEISFQGYERFSIVFDFRYFKSNGRSYFNDYNVKDISIYLDEVQKNLLENN